MLIKITKTCRKSLYYLIMLILTSSTCKVFSNSNLPDTLKSNIGILSIGNQTIFLRYPAIYFNNETKVLHPSFSIIQELGLNFNFIDPPSLAQEEKRTSMNTSIGLEPRWYYKNGESNFNKNQRTNLFNPFVALKLHSNIRLGFVYYSNVDKNEFYPVTDFDPINVSFIIPRWGFRGIINNIIYYELGLGLAYYYRFGADEEFMQNVMTKGFLPEINAKIGIRLYNAN